MPDKRRAAGKDRTAEQKRADKEKSEKMTGKPRSIQQRIPVTGRRGQEERDEAGVRHLHAVQVRG